MKTVAFHNLGCKVNSYEMDIMQQKFIENDFQVVPFDKKADVYVVNTCTVTNIADRKSRQMLHRAKKENPDSVVIAVGCYVQTQTKEVSSDASVDIAIGNNKKSEIVEILKEYLEKKEKEEKTSGGLLKETFTKVLDINHTPEYESMFLIKTLDRTRAYIKIEDGCNQFCSYCLIPYARGRVRSRDMEEIIREIKELTQKGYKEFVLTGIHVSSYMITSPNDLSENRLAELLERIQQIEGVKRIRLSSLEPRVITRDFVLRISKLDKLCPHFHLSLQSGSDETLKRMNRHYTGDDFLRGVKLLREYFDNPAITTDIIAGFPGESQKEFEESFDFAKKVSFYEMHVFKYSKRKGTVAEKLPGQVSDSDKEIRSHRLIELSKKLSGDYRETFLGKIRPVLFEEETELFGKKYMSGHTPEYIRVWVENADIKENEIYNVMLKTGFTDEILTGEIIK